MRKFIAVAIAAAVAASIVAIASSSSATPSGKPSPRPSHSPKPSASPRPPRLWESVACSTSTKQAAVKCGTRLTNKGITGYTPEPEEKKSQGWETAKPPTTKAAALAQTATVKKTNKFPAAHVEEEEAA